MIRYLAIFLVLFSGCTTYTSRIDNAPGRPTVYEDVSSPGLVQGVGIESQDIVSMTSVMVKDLLATPVIAGRDRAPRIIVDSKYFENRSSNRIDKDIITSKLRTGLNRNSQGRMVFVGRENIGMVEEERAIKRSGKVDQGVIRQTKATLGADFRLVGKIMSLDGVSASGVTSRYNIINFEMYDLESGAIVWSNEYEFKKSSQAGVVYR